MDQQFQELETERNKHLKLARYHEQLAVYIQSKINDLEQENLELKKVLYETL